MKFPSFVSPSRCESGSESESNFEDGHQIAISQRDSSTTANSTRLSTSESATTELDLYDTASENSTSSPTPTTSRQHQIHNFFSRSHFYVTPQIHARAQRKFECGLNALILFSTWESLAKNNSQTSIIYVSLGLWYLSYSLSRTFDISASASVFLFLFIQLILISSNSLMQSSLWHLLGVLFVLSEFLWVTDYKIFKDYCPSLHHAYFSLSLFPTFIFWLLPLFSSWAEKLNSTEDVQDAFGQDVHSIIDGVMFLAVLIGIFILFLSNLKLVFSIITIQIRFFLYTISILVPYQFLISYAFPLIFHNLDSYSSFFQTKVPCAIILLVFTSFRPIHEREKEVLVLRRLLVLLVLFGLIFDYLFPFVLEITPIVFICYSFICKLLLHVCCVSASLGQSLWTLQLWFPRFRLLNRSDVDTVQI